MVVQKFLKSEVEPLGSEGVESEKGRIGGGEGESPPLGMELGEEVGLAGGVFGGGSLKVREEGDGETVFGGEEGGRGTGELKMPMEERQGRMGQLANFGDGQGLVRGRARGVVGPLAEILRREERRHRGKRSVPE